MSASSLPLSPCAPNAPAATPTKADAAPIKKNSLSIPFTFQTPTRGSSAAALTGGSAAALISGSSAAALIKEGRAPSFNLCCKSSGRLQHLARVAARGLCDLGPGKHARDLFDSAATIKLFDADLSAPARAVLADEQVCVREARDLRLMRHAEHLVCARERLQLQPDGLGDAPADARVHLVEDNRAREASGTRARLQAEHQARSLAARSDLRQRTQRLACVGREVELDAVEARRVEAPRSLLRGE